MTSDGGIVGWIARLHPALALVVIIGAFVLGRIAGIAAAFLIAPDTSAPMSSLSIVAGTPIAVVIYIGYPVTIAIHVLRTHGSVTQVRPARLVAALLVMLPALVIAMAFFAEPGRPGAGTAIVVNIAILAWLGGVFYIMWAAARGLVQAEDGRAVALNRLIGTFFMFYFLPFGIYFLQRRVRRLAASGMARQAA